MDYPKKFKELRKEWGGRCVECGDTHRLEFAHLPGKPTGIEGKGRGMPQRYYDIRNNPQCYVLLCQRDHKKLDGRTWNYTDPVEEHPE